MVLVAKNSNNGVYAHSLNVWVCVKIIHGFIFEKGTDMKKKLLNFSAITALFIITSLQMGCAVNRATAVVDPTVNMNAIKTVYVEKLSADSRGIDLLIAQKANSMGMTATTLGQQTTTPPDAILTYVDKWMWDITMYMLELTIQVKDPKTDFVFASGNSFHTSLTRKSPVEMVEEVMTNIFIHKGKIQNNEHTEKQ